MSRGSKLHDRKTVKYGVISTARIAVNKHIPAIQDSTNGEVVAISSRDLALAKSEAARLGIPKYYGSYNELICGSGCRRGGESAA